MSSCQGKARTADLATARSAVSYEYRCLECGQVFSHLFLCSTEQNNGIWVVSYYFPQTNNSTT